MNQARQAGEWNLKTSTATDPAKYMDGSGWNWTGFTATKGAGVIGFPSIQRGVTNDNNDASGSGLPYALGDNSEPFVIDNETWDVWDAIQDVSGRDGIVRRWPVIQFRARDKKNAFDKNLNRFFAEAIKRHPAWFPSDINVLNVDTGTEIKDGSGKVYNDAYHVSVY